MGCSSSKEKPVAQQQNPKNDAIVVDEKPTKTGSDEPKQSRDVKNDSKEKGKSDGKSRNPAL